MRVGFEGSRVVAVALLISAPATAFAHAKLVTPTPRVDSDAIKTGPCGAPRTNTATTYQPGQTVTVRWRESIDHNGCFDVLFSEANDKGWVRLRRFADDGGTGNTDYAAEITLPSTPCQGCTLALRQVMMDSVGVGGQPATTGVCSETTPDELDGGYTTYFSCADIQLVPGADGGAVVVTDAGASSSGGGSGASGGPTTTPVDGGGRFVNEGPDGPSDLKAGKGEDCSVGWGAAPGASAFAAGLSVLALLRRRRRAR